MISHYTLNMSASSFIKYLSQKDEELRVDYINKYFDREIVKKILSHTGYFDEIQSLIPREHYFAFLNLIAPLFDSVPELKERVMTKQQTNFMNSLLSFEEHFERFKYVRKYIQEPFVKNFLFKPNFIRDIKKCLLAKYHEKFSLLLQLNKIQEWDVREFSFSNTGSLCLVTNLSGFLTQASTALAQKKSSKIPFERLSL